MEKNKGMLLKVMQVLIKLKFSVLLSPNYNFKIMNLQLRINKFMTTLVLRYKKIESENKRKFDTLYSHSKAEIIINENDIDGHVFKSIYTTITSTIQKFLEKVSGWVIDSVIEHNINILKYTILAGSSYIKLTKELGHPRKGVINI